MKNQLVIGGLVLLWACAQALSNQLLFMPEAAINICPDGKGICPPETTCCGLKDGGYACCPVPEATCCSDNKHCCPKSYRCDVAAQQCVHEDGNSAIGWATKVPATPAPIDKAEDVGGRSVVCPDQTSQCMDHQTCCQLQSGAWACCPLPNAVCCADHTHCCPQSYICDPASASCIKKTSESDSSSSLLSVTVPWHSFKPFRDVDIVKCDAEVSCRDGQTCCKTKTGTWACCPVPKAVCCADMLHCCPSGYKCQPSSGMCVKGSATLALLEVAASTTAAAVNDVRCDDQSSCPDGQTCCKMTTGRYGCCPLPEAVCCSDKIHCCPHSYTCNIAAGTCDLLGVQIPWSTKVPAIPTHSEKLENPSEDTEKSAEDSEKPSEDTENSMEVAAAGSTECRGGAWCKSGSTCCESSDGSLRGCCNLENAVCCGDGTHCCPAGTRCDSEAGMCRSVGSTLALSWYLTRRVEGVGSLREIGAVAGVECPDGSSCPKGSTCCQLPSKQYACCPYDKGVCCEDQMHCCPHSMTCDVAHSRCVQTGSGFSLPFHLFTRSRSRSRGVLERDLSLSLSKDTCPDLSSVCAENSTCCLTQSGAYGCCPHKNAVCCSDKLHCCPYGTTCDLAKQGCVASVNNNKNNNNKEAEKEENKNVVEDDEDDIPFPALNPYRRLN